MYSLLISCNCATGVNSLFSLAGIPEEVRTSLNDFAGFDSGADELFDEDFLDAVAEDACND